MTGSLQRRRTLLKAALAGVAAGLAGQVGLRAARADWPAEAFAAKAPAAALQALFDGAAITPSDAIAIDLPALAEDGAVVPIGVTAKLPSVESIHIIAGKNPVPLIARFDFGAHAAGGYVATRIKLAESSHVTVVVKAGGRLYSAEKYIEVTKGGCD